MPGHSPLGSALVGAEVLKNASHTNAPKCINPQTKQLRMESHNIKMALDPPKGANFPMEPNPQKHQPGAYSNTGNRLRIIGGYHFNPPPPHIFTPSLCLVSPMGLSLLPLRFPLWRCRSLAAVSHYRIFCSDCIWVPVCIIAMSETWGWSFLFASVVIPQLLLPTFLLSKL